MEKKQPTPRFDSEKLMTVSCLTRLIVRKLARLVPPRRRDGSGFSSTVIDEVLRAPAAKSLVVSSAHIDRLELAMLTRGDSAIVCRVV